MTGAAAEVELANGESLKAGQRDEDLMPLIIIILVLLLLFGGGGYYGFNSGLYGGAGYGGISVLGIVLIILAVYFLMGRGRV